MNESAVGGSSPSGATSAITMKKGDKVSWKTIGRDASGIIESVNGDMLLVRLPSGKHVLVNTQSAQYEADKNS